MDREHLLDMIAEYEKQREEAVIGNKNLWKKTKNIRNQINKNKTKAKGAKAKMTMLQLLLDDM